jgi:hypothetical protein
MRSIKISDSNFSHARTSTDIQISKHIIWDRNISLNDDLVIFTDNQMMGAYNYTGKKIGIIIEPKDINSGIYEWVKDNFNQFDKILTYDKELLDISDKFKFYPHSGCWIFPDDQKIYPKTKLLSIISSEKRQTIGHNLRHTIVDICKKNNIDVDVFGRGYNPIGNKKYALSDYAYSIVIENSKSNYYFTEKLIDSFVTGTIPIYWGCPLIEDFFNEKGMIIFENEIDFIDKINNLTIERYIKMLPYIQENFDKALNYLMMENWIIENNLID